jgi:hypothetical protein
MARRRSSTFHFEIHRRAEVSALAPEAVLARTLTVPLPAGLVAVHCVADEQLTPVAAFAPNIIAVTRQCRLDLDPSSCLVPSISGRVK